MRTAMKQRLRAMCAMLVTVLSTVSFGEDEVVVKITYKSAGGCSGGSETFLYDAGDPITILNITGCVELINIYAVSSNHDIGHVTLEGDPSFDVFVRLESGPWNGNANALFMPRCRDWAGLSVNGDFTDKVHLEGAIARNLTNEVVVGQVHRLQILGSLARGIQAVSTSANAVVRIDAGAISYPGNITALSGGITRIEVVGDVNGGLWASSTIGDIVIGGNIMDGLFADEIFTGGSIHVVNVAGDIGAPGSPVSIVAQGVGTGNGIYSVEADAIHASITGPSDDCGEAIRSVYARSGVYSGDISAVCFSTDVDDDPGEVFGWNVEGDVVDTRVNLGLNFGEPTTIAGLFDADSLVRAGRSFSPKADVAIETAAGLQGQIIINANSNPNDPGEWPNGTTDDTRTDVKVGPVSSQIVLAPIPYYDNPSSSFGGGAVGLVPFNGHDQDCTPVGFKDDDDSDGVDDLDPCEWGYHAIERVGPGGQVSSVTIRHDARSSRAGRASPSA